MDNDNDDDVLGSAFGLGSVLAQVGVDSVSLSAFLERTEGAASRDLAAAIENEQEDKFMDDVSEASLPDESSEDKEARIREQAAIKAEEERWARRAAAELAGTSTAGPSAEAKKKRRQRESTENDLIKRAWPDFQQGSVLKMSEIFYETPGDLISINTAVLSKKRRLLTGLPHEECELLLF